jgi:hypothetical protein
MTVTAISGQQTGGRAEGSGTCTTAGTKFTVSITELAAWSGFVTTVRAAVVSKQVELKPVPLESNVGPVPSQSPYAS